MTSEPGGECYVYITLPGETEAVTAGRFTLSVDRRGTPLGRFVYGRRQHARFLLDREEAEAILTEIERCVAGKWYDVARAAGVSEQDYSRISGAFAYPGFRYALSDRAGEKEPEPGREE